MNNYCIFIKQTHHTMKTLILILTITLTLTVNAQGGYKLYSKVWSKNETKDILPAKSREFNSNLVDSISKLIDTNKIKSMLLTSFNEFRRDYGKSSVTGDDNLTKQSVTYSRCLVNKFKHDYSLNGYWTECIATFSVYHLTSIKKSDGDINKIISDCLIDVFAYSVEHTEILLSEHLNYGIGVTLKNNTFYIVIRGNLLKK